MGWGPAVSRARRSQDLAVWYFERLTMAFYFRRQLENNLETQEFG